MASAQPVVTRNKMYEAVLRLTFQCIQAEAEELRKQKLKKFRRKLLAKARWHVSIWGYKYVI